MKRRESLTIIGSAVASITVTGLIFKLTPTNNPRRRVKAKVRVKTKIAVLENEILSLLAKKEFLAAITLLESGRFKLIEPRPGNESGFKLLNLLAGLKLRHQGAGEFGTFIQRMDKYAVNYPKFSSSLYGNWHNEAFAEKWALKNDRTEKNIRTWSGNVV